MNISTQDIQALRHATGVGMMQAKKALHEAGGDKVKAIARLRKAGQKIAAQKSERVVKEGTVGIYLHANHRIAALVALACETDFVARTEDFQTLAHDLAIQVAATNPRYLQPADVPGDVLAAEEAVYRGQLEAEGKPQAMWDKILPGKMKKFYADACLLEQAYVKDDSLTIEQVLLAAITKLGENIQITGFSRLSV